MSKFPLPIETLVLPGQLKCLAGSDNTPNCRELSGPEAIGQAIADETLLYGPQWLYLPAKHGNVIMPIKHFTAEPVEHARTRFCVTFAAHDFDDRDLARLEWLLGPGDWAVDVQNSFKYPGSKLVCITRCPLRALCPFVV